MASLDPRISPDAHLDLDAPFQAPDLDNGVFAAEFYEEEEPIELVDSFDCVVVLDNLPKVDEKKLSKLEQVVNKILATKTSAQVAEQGMYMPRDENGKTIGAAFVRFVSVQDAATAKSDLDGFKMDKKHKWCANLFEDFEKFAGVPDELEIKVEDYKGSDDLYNFLMDDKARDQYVVHHGTETEIWWNDPYYMANENGRSLQNAGERHKAEGKNWTELGVQWSSKGTYLSTFHNPGILLWGGDEFNRLARFGHAGVKLVQFSPQENFVVTCNTRDKKNPGEPDCIQVWDVRTQKLLRGFNSGSSPRWPSFLWSHNDEFIARMGKDKAGTTEVISVYEVPSMGLLNKKSIKVPGLRDIQWSPTQNLLAYYVPEQGSRPATVSIMELPSKAIKRDARFFKVDSAEMYWHNRGDYLAVLMQRKVSKKTSHHFLEIFRVKNKNIPLESFEMKDEILSFAWEPNGHRFAIIHTDGRETNVSFFRLRAKKLEKIAELPGRKCNRLYWSPTGGHIILATLGPSTGELEFVVLTENDTAITVATREHYMCRTVQWDRSGRFVLTAVTQTRGDPDAWKYAQENGYRIWTFDGKDGTFWKCTTSVKLDNCYHVQWRPRPATVLSKGQQRALRASLKEKFYSKFEAEDEKCRLLQLGEADRVRHELVERWKAFRSVRRKEYLDQKKIRRDLRNGEDSDDEGDIEVVEEWVETTLETTEEIVA
jgi:translation initiation factor 3 subunit B